MPKIYLYAEILTHIRQLNLHASVETEKREGTKLDLTTDKKVITVTHDGETQRLYLPTQIKGDATVTFPLLKTTDVSARLQIEDENEWKCMISNEIEAPWMATDLSSSVALCCRHCQSVVLEPQKVREWKDLPSESWAELMDFWFCHKPHEEEQDHAQEAAAVKGFSSTSKIAVSPGTGMTDLISIVLHADDCSNVKASEKQRNPDTTMLRCSRCLKILGTTNDDENLVRLHKASITVSMPDDPTTWSSFPRSIFICAEILSLIEATNLKKFVVHSVPLESPSTGEIQSADPLLLWVFNPDIYYSCSAYEGNARLSQKNIGAASGAVSAPEHGPSLPAMYNTVSTAESHSNQLQATLQTTQNDNNSKTNDSSPILGEVSDLRSASRDIDIDLEEALQHKQESSNPVTSNPRSTIKPVQDMATSPMRVEPTDTHQTEPPSTTNNSVSTQSSPNPMPPSEADEHINLVHRAAKIFYKSLPPDTSPAEFLDQPANASTHEELYLPDPADLVSLREALGKSTSMLPANTRRFQDWDVGLLDRFERVPSGLGVMAQNPLARGIQAKDGRVTRWDLGRGAEGLFA